MAVDVVTRPRRPACPAPRARSRASRSSRRAAVDKTYDTGKVQVHALRGIVLRRQPRRDGRDHGAERLRQDDAPQLPLRASTRSTTGTS